MSIRAWAEAALATTLESIGDPVTFANPAGGTQTVNAQVIRVDSMVDPQTGARVFAPHTAVTARLSSLTVIPEEGWRIATTDIQGRSISGRARDLEFDYTMGTLTVMIEIEDVPVVTFNSQIVTFEGEAVTYAGN